MSDFFSAHNILATDLDALDNATAEASEGKRLFGRFSLSDVMLVEYFRARNAIKRSVVKR